MGGADVAAGGFQAGAAAPQPWADDFSMNAYLPCDTTTSPATGACPDRAFVVAAQGASVSNVVLLNATLSDGVQTLFLTRPLGAHDAVLDIALDLASPRTYIWAHGSLRAGAPGQAPAFLLAQHAAGAYDIVDGVRLGACPTEECAPLTAAAAAPPAPPAPEGFAAPLMLSGGGVTLSWQLSPTSVVFVVRGLSASTWASIAIGDGMVGSHAYVAWTENGAMRFSPYSMSSLDASGVSQSAGENVTLLSSSSQGGAVSFTFSRLLAANGNAPGLDATSTHVLWALGNGWSGDGLSSGAQHFARSSVATVVNLRTGAFSFAAPVGPSAALVAHGVLMAVAFALLLPSAIGAARYLKAGGVLRTPSAWFMLHKALAALALSCAAGGVAAALIFQRDTRGTLQLLSLHARLGVAGLVLMAAQPLNALLRPPAQPPSARRTVWALLHRLGGGAALGAATAALYTGLQLSCTLGLAGRCDALQRSLSVWLASVAVAVFVREAARGVMLLVSRRRRVSRVLADGEPALEEGSVAGADYAAAKAAAAEAAATSVESAQRSELRWAVAAAAWFALAALFTALVAAGYVGGTAVLEAAGGGTNSAAAAGVAAQGMSFMPPPPPVAAAPPPPGSASDAQTSMPACGLQRVFELSRLGDGWCDAAAPYNTAGCNWDGGDCCNASAPLFDCRDPASRLFGTSAPKGVISSAAPINPRYTVDSLFGRPVSTETLVTTYNNYYEYTTSKSVSPLVTRASVNALSLSSSSFPGWTITIDGLVASPITLDVRALIAMFGIEKRFYRHRCVEAWSIALPWIGFPLRKILSLVQPLASATYVSFNSASSSTFPLQSSSPSGLFGAAWPYLEGLSINESWADIAFVAVGIFNDPLPPQNGAPIRLVLPWKYGFKSAKSLTRITFTDQQPRNWWQQISPREYGFWANVNPAFPHPRWSQAQESQLIASTSGAVIPTQIFNSYGGEVSYMYGDDHSWFF